MIYGTISPSPSKMSIMRRLLPLLTLASSIYAAETNKYCWGFLNSHPERTELPQTQAQEIQKGHMEHLGKMAKEGHLISAGPLATPGGARGLLVFKCDSSKQAADWAAPDPAVQNKRLAVEMYDWRAIGVWGEPLASKLKADPNYKYQMVQLPFAVLMVTDKAAAAGRIPPEIGKEHLDYSLELSKQGKLRSFGPFLNGKGKMGVLIYGAMKLEEAKQLAESDPMVKAGWAKPEVYMWHVADESVPKP